MYRRQTSHIKKMKKNKMKKLEEQNSLLKVAYYFQKKWILENPQFKGFEENPEYCFENVKKQKNHLLIFMISLSIFLLSLGGFVCTLLQITLFLEVSMETGSWIFLGSFSFGIISGITSSMLFITLLDNRLGKTCKKLAKDWGVVRKKILNCEDLTYCFKNVSESLIDNNRMIEIFDFLLKKKGSEVRKSEIEGKLWIKNKIRPQMSEIYNIGNELGLKQPKFETYFAKS